MLLVSIHKSLITCVIRIDIAHLIKAVCRWPCFIHVPASVKDFFVRCVGILSKCTTINDFSRICTDVLSVAFTSLEDVEDINNHVTVHNVGFLKSLRQTLKHVITVVTEI